MSSEDVALTGGQSGYVVVDILFSPQTELCRWKIYSLARVATLLAIALNFVEFNTVTQINCQVGHPPPTLSRLLSDPLRPKVWLAFELVSNF
jgi:hypothetical protein